MSLFTIILNVMFPPVAVLINRGFGGAFLLNVVLTILGWIPGVIHAIIVNQNTKL